VYVPLNVVSIIVPLIALGKEITPVDRVLVEKLLVTHLVYKLPAFNPSLKLGLDFNHCPGWRA
jgi:hypothetical protein